ncbi:MAG: hypothetical protein Kow0065_06500 [Methylomicrobium sp.]
MYAYKEIVTLDNPQQLNLKKPLPFLKGKKVEVLIIVDDEDMDETEAVLQDKALMRQIELSRQTHRDNTGYHSHR